MWETVGAGAGGLMGLYVALRREIRRSYELLDKNIGYVDGRLGQAISHVDERLSQQISYVDERLSQQISYVDERLSQQISHVDERLSRQISHVDEGLKEVRADIRRLDGKIDAVRGELIGFLGSR